MKFGLQVYSFTWLGGPHAIGPTLQSVSLFIPNAWRSTTESADQLVDRFGRLGHSGVQQVINTADVHNPDTIELLAAEVMPQFAESRT